MSSYFKLLTCSEGDIVVGERLGRFRRRRRRVRPHLLHAAARHLAAAASASAADERDAIGPNVESRLDVGHALGVAFLATHLLSAVRTEVAIRKERVALPATRDLAALQPPLDRKSTRLNS